MYDKEAAPIGGYNKLCNPPPNPFNHPPRDASTSHPARRAEKVAASSQTAKADNCTETHVAPRESWVNYAPNSDFMTTRGHYTVS